MKIIMPGRCFRNETISARSHVSFHQVDGFLVDEGVTMADLKGAGALRLRVPRRPPLVPGLADDVLPLDQIPGAVVRYLS